MLSDAEAQRLRRGLEEAIALAAAGHATAVTVFAIMHRGENRAGGKPLIGVKSWYSSPAKTAAAWTFHRKVRLIVGVMTGKIEAFDEPPAEDHLRG